MSEMSSIFFDVVFSTRIINAIRPTPTPSNCLPVYSLMFVNALKASMSKTKEYINENLYGKSFGK